jgi:UDP-glucose 4-epimerase
MAATYPAGSLEKRRGCVGRFGGSAPGYPTQVRIVVTGASGNVGTALLERLTGSGDVDVVGLSRREPPARPPYNRAEWVRADIGNPDARETLTQAFTGADAVVHLAWLIQPSRARPVMIRANQDGTAAVTDAAVAAGVPHLVHQSSIGAYSPAHGRLVDESWPTAGVPTSTYSVDKAAAERIVDRAEPHLTVTRVRPGLVFQDAAASEVARYFLGPLVPRVLVRREVLRLAPFSDALAFQVVHADDVAAALELIVRRQAGGAFNVAAPPVIDRAAFREVFGGVGPPVPPRVLRTVASATWHARLQQTEPGWIDLAAQVPRMDTGRLEALGWSAQRDARDVLGGFVDAIRRKAGGDGPLLYPAGRAHEDAAP